jgi:hypothetical protein
MEVGARKKHGKKREHSPSPDAKAPNKKLAANRDPDADYTFEWMKSVALNNVISLAQWAKYWFRFQIVTNGWESAPTPYMGPDLIILLAEESYHLAATNLSIVAEEGLFFALRDLKGS